MDSIISAINNRDVQSLVHYLNGKPDIREFIHSLNTLYADNKLLFLHDKKSRAVRDDFFDNVIRLLTKKDSDCVNLLISRRNIIKVAEFILDKISQQLASCEITQHTPEIQAWSLIVNTENIIEEILGADFSDGEIIDDSSFNFKVKDKNGNDYDPDDLLHSHINALTLSLKYLAYKYKWEQGGKYIFPDKVVVRKDHVDSSEDVKLLGAIRQNLIRVVDGCFYFNGFVATHSKEQMDEIKIKYNIKEDINYSFFYPLNSYLYYEHIACERFRQRHYQELMEIIHCVGRGNINRKRQVLIDRELTYFFFEHYFCCDIRKDKVKYNNLRLIEWADSFLALKQLANEVLERKGNAIFKRLELIKYLERYGVPTKSASSFLNMITFGKDSTDLFDTPLIKIQGDKIYLLTSALYQLNAFRVTVSRLPSVEKNLGAKGYGFEKQIIDMLKSNNIIAKKFRREISDEKYEYDCVFILDDKIFLFECKNKNIAWGNPDKIYRNAVFYQKAIEQVKRLKESLIKYPEILKEEFGIDVAQYEIVSAIYNCLPFSMKGKVDGVYIADHSSFSRLVKSSYINQTQIYGEVSKSNYKQWLGEKLCAEDIINHFNNPFQLGFYEEALKQYNTSHTVNDVTFSIVDYITDMERLRSNKTDFFKK
jgi:hypothetical protein